MYAKEKNSYLWKPEKIDTDDIIVQLLIQNCPKLPWHQMKFDSQARRDLSCKLFWSMLGIWNDDLLKAGQCSEPWCLAMSLENWAWSNHCILAHIGVPGDEPGNNQNWRCAHHVRSLAVPCHIGVGGQGAKSLSEIWLFKKTPFSIHFIWAVEQKCAHIHDQPGRWKWFEVSWRNSSSFLWGNGSRALRNKEGK